MSFDLEKRRARLLALTALALLAAVLPLLSCSGHLPELTAVEYRLSVSPLDSAGSEFGEQLSVFAAVRDEDGFKDLAALHVLHDESEYLWTLVPESWTRRDQNKEIWIGSTGLSSPDAGLLPRGLYRVVLEDLAGGSDQTSFTLGAGLEAGLEFPVIRKEGELVIVLSKYARTELLFLDRSGSVLRSVEAPRTRKAMDYLYGSSAWKTDVGSLLAYAYDPERNLGIFSRKQAMQP